jgi:hypothetical protein
MRISQCPRCSYVVEDGVVVFVVESVELDVDVEADSDDADFAVDSAVAGFESPLEATLVSDDWLSEEPLDLDA